MDKSRLLTIGVLVTLIVLPLLSMAEATSAEPSGLDEALAIAYLEKRVPQDTGSCLVDQMKIDIIGISDLVPGHQTEVFYKFDYNLRCNRGSEAKKGQGVLRASRLRDGNWIDRETFTLISK